MGGPGEGARVAAAQDLGQRQGMAGNWQPERCWRAGCGPWGPLPSSQGEAGGTPLRPVHCLRVEVTSGGEGPPAKISWSELAEHSGSGTTRGSCGQQSIFQASQGSQAVWGRSAHDGSMGKPREGERKVGRASRGKERRGGPWWESRVHTQPLVCPGNGGFALLVLAFSEELRPAEVAWGAFWGRLSAHPILLSRDVAKVTCASCPL